MELDRMSPTPYDDVFRTMMNDCSSLVIPLINEMFGEHYTGNEQIVFSPNEHFLNQQDGNETKRITDASFSIIGATRKRYHMECESSNDNRFLIRLFEYDAQIALDQDSSVIGNRLIVNFPNTAVLYLRNNGTTPDVMEIEIRTPGGSVTYTIPTMKVQAYSLDEIFSKHLYFLIPFYIFTYEKRFGEISEDQEKLHELFEEYQSIQHRLEEHVNAGNLTEYDRRTILEMSNRVIQHLAVKFENIQKGVNAIMGGRVLDYEAKRILNQGIDKGIDQGIDKGKNIGITGAVSMLRSLGHDEREIKDNLMKTYELSEEEAEGYLRRREQISV